MRWRNRKTSLTSQDKSFDEEFGDQVTIQQIKTKLAAESNPDGAANLAAALGELGKPKVQ
jgi:hypothetical protein